MVKALTASELEPGSAFRNGLVSRSNIEEKRGKGPDIKLTLATDFRQCSAKKWQSDKAEIRLIRPAQFLVISGTVDTVGPYEGEVTITSVRAAVAEEIPADLTPYLPDPPHDHREQQRRFSDLMRSVCEPNLHQLLRVIFDPKEPTWKAFCNAFAAKTYHHAYRGGLLEHSAEVAEFCGHICTVQPALRRDLLISAALLHDIGKLDEMDHGLSAGEFTDSGTLEGHVFSGAYRVRHTAERVPRFPPNLKSALAHLILSHHGLPEYGAAKKPACAEAHVLAQCDMMSARIYECQTAAASADALQISVRLPGKEDRHVYVGDLGLQSVPAPLVLQASSSVPHPQKQEAAPLAAETISFTTTRRLPVLGLVAAGSPEQSSEEEDETREAAPPPRGADYLVRVTGDSMVDAGLQERDLLFVKTTEKPKSGDIVVAHITASEEVVKRFHREPAADDGMANIWLVSENGHQNYPPIAVDSDTRIRGVVTGLLRDF